jgi:hypothetical protein
MTQRVEITCSDSFTRFYAFFTTLRFDEPAAARAAARSTSPRSCAATEQKRENYDQTTIVRRLRE